MKTIFHAAMTFLFIVTLPEVLIKHVWAKASKDEKPTTWDLFRSRGRSKVGFAEAAKDERTTKPPIPPKVKVNVQ